MDCGSARLIYAGSVAEAQSSSSLFNSSFTKDFKALRQNRTDSRRRPGEAFSASWSYPAGVSVLQVIWGVGEWGRRVGRGGGANPPLVLFLSSNSSRGVFICFPLCWVPKCFEHLACVFNVGVALALFPSFQAPSR